MFSVGNVPMKISAYFKPQWLPTILTLLAVALFIQLGLWQLRRSAEKQALLDQREKLVQEAEIHLDGKQLSIESLRYRPVMVTGIWDPDHQFLLDNRMHQGKVGYEVLTPLEILGSDRVVMVNRGWVPASPDRRQLPPIKMERRPVTIHGIVDHFPRYGMTLKGMDIPSETWPAVVQQADPKIISQRLGKPVLPYQILMRPDQPEGFVRDWTLSHVKPEKHTAYALQWFSFAAIAFGLWGWHGWKRAGIQKNRA